MNKLIKILCVVLSLSFVICLAACSGKDGGETTTVAAGDDSAVPANLKIGIILVGDENEGYTYAHMEGIKAAAASLGIPDNQIIWKYSIPEDEKCYDTAMDLVEAGCTYIFSNSYSHQSYMQKAAGECPNVNFVAMTGDTAAPSGLANFSNAFTKVFESRYVSGIVAGMKLKELMDSGKVTDPKVGYVGAYPYAEVVSGYTAFFLGIRSIVPEATMVVQYTSSWFDFVAEGEAANALIAAGCCIIGQHADSEGAPRAVQAALDSGKVVYSVGYNVDMLTAAPTAALTSATNVWSVYYTYALGQAVKGERIATNVAEGYAEDAVAITALGTSCAQGTQAKVDEAVAAIKAGTLHVFDTSTFTVGGETLTSYDKTYGFEGNELISDGYFHESELRSAPAFDIRIDGITELNAGTN